MPMGSSWKLCLALGAMLASTPATAEFYRWIDADGKPRVSNITPSGVRADGRVKKHHHPYAWHNQQQRMRTRLQRQARNLAAEQAAAVAASERRRLSLQSLFDAVGGAKERALDATRSDPAHAAAADPGP